MHASRFTRKRLSRAVNVSHTQVGIGKKTYEAGKKLLLRWGHFQLGWAEVSSKGVKFTDKNVYQLSHTSLPSRDIMSQPGLACLLAHVTLRILTCKTLGVTNKP